MHAPTRRAVLVRTLAAFGTTCLLALPVSADVTIQE